MHVRTSDSFFFKLQICKNKESLFDYCVLSLQCLGGGYKTHKSFVLHFYWN